MGERAPYSRVYWAVVDDPKFATIYHNNDHLATWLRLLIAADAIWPASAELPRSARKASVTALVDARLVDLKGDHHYRIHGLDAERQRRKDAATTRGPKGDQEDTERSPSGDQTVLDTDTSRARDAMLGSSSNSSAGLGSASAREDDAHLDAWYRLTASWPSDRVLPWLNELADTYSPDAVSQALATEVRIDPSRKTLISRTRDRLAMAAHEDSKKRAAQRQSQAIEDREHEAAMAAEMSDEQRKANMDRLRSMLTDSGLLAPKPQPRTQA